MPQTLRAIPLPTVGFSALVFVFTRPAHRKYWSGQLKDIPASQSHPFSFLSKEKRLGTLNLTGFQEPRLPPPPIPCLVTLYFLELIFHPLPQPPSLFSHQPESPSSQGRLNKWGLNFTHQCVSQRMFSPLGENASVQKYLGLLFCVDYSGGQMLPEYQNVQEDKRTSEWAGRDIPKQGSGTSLVGTERKKI